MILLPGALSSRTERRSELSFSWDARDCSLRALSGQQGTLTQTAPAGTTVPGDIVPASGPTVQAGKGQSRFGRVGAENVLDLTGTTAGKDQEKLWFPYALHLHDLTVYMKLTGLWTPGANLGTSYLFAIGSGATDGGQLRLTRTGTVWRLERRVPGGTGTADLTEQGSMVWPVEVRVTYTHASKAASLSLRGANGTTYGPVTTGTGIPTVSGRFAGDVLGLGSDPTLGQGSPMRLYRAKIALALYGYDPMVVLA